MKQYTSAQVAAAAGVTLRQVQWWDERAVVSPTRPRNCNRKYEFREAVTFAVIAELRRKGFSLQSIRSILGNLRIALHQSLAEGREVHILTDCKAVFCDTDTGRIVELLHGARNPMALVSVSRLIRKLNEIRR